MHAAISECLRAHVCTLNEIDSVFALLESPRHTIPRSQHRLQRRRKLIRDIAPPPGGATTQAPTSEIEQWQGKW